jgi:hypothetical protein
MIRFFIPLLLAAYAAPLSAACTVQSGPARAALIELYTSEGCSSCPPADHWLATLPHDPQRLVPLALHVDYWDYIGWRDPYAQPLFSQRQRDQSGSGFVYTPQVMLNGQDYRNWRSSAAFEHAVDVIHRSPANADIKLTMAASASTLDISATAASPHPNAALYLAVYENTLTSTVTAGENGGATLHHEYVVRKWLGPYSLESTVHASLALNPAWKKPDIGMAAFVQAKGGEVLQAVAGKVCD